MKNNKLDTLTNGIIKNNPVFRLVLGTCPTLAVTTSAFNGLYMGLATTFVLMCANILVSLLRKIIPDKVRIPCFIVIIATFSTIVEMVMRAFLPELNKSLGIYIPLIVVNCIILGRAEAFASSHTVFDSALDGLGIGVGFSFALTLMGLVREFLGAGTAFGFQIPALSDVAMTVFILPAGGFLAFAFLMAAFNASTDKITESRNKRKTERMELKAIVVNEIQSKEAN